MKYPDGTTIRVGDLIWWNEGECVGYIQVIAESENEYRRWGLDTPHIFLSNNHPFDPTMLIGVAYPESSMADDGIGLLTEQERSELERMRIRAFGLIPRDLAYSFYSVNTEVENFSLVRWVFAFYMDDVKVLGIEVPVK